MASVRIAVGRLGICMLYFLFISSLRLVRERRGGWSAGIMRLWYEFFTGLQYVVPMNKCSLCG
jgi:hypothetical protein